VLRRGEAGEGVAGVVPAFVIVQARVGPPPPYFFPYRSPYCMPVVLRGWVHRGDRPLKQLQDKNGGVRPPFVKVLAAHAPHRGTPCSLPLRGRPARPETHRTAHCAQICARVRVSLRSRSVGSKRKAGAEDRAPLEPDVLEAEVQLEVRPGKPAKLDGWLVDAPHTNFNDLGGPRAVENHTSAPTVLLQALDQWGHPVRFLPRNDEARPLPPGPGPSRVASQRRAAGPGRGRWRPFGGGSAHLRTDGAAHFRAERWSARKSTKPLSG